MTRRIRTVLWPGLLGLALCWSCATIHASAAGHDRLYVVLVDEAQDPEIPAAVAVFKVDESGGLEQEGTYPTGGYASAGDSEPSPSVDAARGRLFVPNNASNDVSVFTIHEDGSLEAVPGSPFPTGAGPSYNAVHPGGRFLYVLQWREATLGVYEVTESGQLVARQTVGPLGAGQIEVSPDGDFLYMADIVFGVRAYAIAADGTLAELPGSPFTYPAMDRPAGVELASDGGTLLVLDLDEGIATFRVEDSGALAPVAGSPFPVGGFSHFFVLTGDDRHAYACSEEQIHGFALQPDGSLSPLSGSPFAEDLFPWALLDGPGTPWLYAGNIAGERLEPYAIAPDGTVESSGPAVGVEDVLGRVPRGAVFYRPAARAIGIDVKPENDTNPINPRSHGVTPVALLGADGFDVTEVDVTSLRFGPGAAAPAHDLSAGWPYSDPLRDVNDDGFPDLLAHFVTRDAGIECGDTEASLTGRLLDGRLFAGADSIRAVGCSHKTALQAGGRR